MDQVLYWEALSKVIGSNSLRSTQPRLIVPSKSVQPLSSIEGQKAYKKVANAHTGFSYDKSEPVMQKGPRLVRLELPDYKIWQMWMVRPSRPPHISLQWTHH